MHLDVRTVNIHFLQDALQRSVLVKGGPHVLCRSAHPAGSGRLRPPTRWSTPKQQQRSPPSHLHQPRRPRRPSRPPSWNTTDPRAPPAHPAGEWSRRTQPLPRAGGRAGAVKRTSAANPPAHPPPQAPSCTTSPERRAPPPPPSRGTPPHGTSPPRQQQQGNIGGRAARATATTRAAAQTAAYPTTPAPSDPPAVPAATAKDQKQEQKEQNNKKRTRHQTRARADPYRHTHLRVCGRSVAARRSRRRSTLGRAGRHLTPLQRKDLAARWAHRQVAVAALEPRQVVGHAADASYKQSTQTEPGGSERRSGGRRSGAEHQTRQSQPKKRRRRYRRS